MSLEHYEQILEDALAVDRRALLLAVQLRRDPFWNQHPFDVTMDKARKLLTVGRIFLEDLQQLLVIGGVFAHYVDETGRVHRIRDPQYFDFDEPLISPPEYVDYLNDNLSRLCSGDQNE
jgi:hypothetical protein